GCTISVYVLVENTSVNVARTDTSAAQIEVRGPDNVLVDNAAAAVTLLLNGENWDGHAALTTAAGATNAGTIVLNSIGYWGDAGITVGGPSFTNTATGLIDVRRGNGSRRWLAGHVINQGLIQVAAASDLPC